MKVVLHQNYSRFGGLDRLFRIALQNGCDGVEVHRLCRKCEPNEEIYLNKLVDFKNSHPDKEIVFGLGVIKFSRGQSDVVASELDSSIKFMEWAVKECGSRVMNLFTDALCPPLEPHLLAALEPHQAGSASATEEDYEKNASHLKTLGDAAASLGVLIALETHHGYIHDIPSSCRKLMDMVNHDFVCVNYDCPAIFF